MTILPTLFKIFFVSQRDEDAFLQVSPVSTELRASISHLSPATMWRQQDKAASAENQHVLFKIAANFLFPIILFYN